MLPAEFTRFGGSVAGQKGPQRPGRFPKCAHFLPELDFDFEGVETGLGAGVVDGVAGVAAGVAGAGDEVEAVEAEASFFAASWLAAVIADCNIVFTTCWMSICSVI